MALPNRHRELLSGDPARLAQWVTRAEPTEIAWVLLLTVGGSGVYGLTVGLWRDEVQAVYTGIKLPLLILLTCGGNILINGFLGQLLGTGLGFRQTMMAILTSFAITGLLLGSFAPVTLFLLWNTPPLTPDSGSMGHSITLLTHVALIAYAGIVGNHRLFRLLQHLAGNRAIAGRALFAWLAGNLLLGSQISWILRPFIGSPGLPVQFLRDDPLRGNFFEAVWASLHTIFFS